MHKRFIVTGFADEIDKDIIRQFEGIKKLGMQYFDPRNVNGKTVSLLTESETEALAEEMKKHDIKVGCIGSRIGKIRIDEDFEAHMEELENTIRIAKRLGTKYIRIFSFYMPPEEKPENYREAVMDRMKRMVALAKKEGVILLHENEKAIYGDSAKRCLDLMEALFCDNFAAVFDPANFVQCDEDTKEAYRLLSPYIRYMHIKDARFSDHVVVPAGMGNGNLQYILKSLFESGYDGFLCLEPHLGNFQGLAELETDNLMAGLPDGGEGTYTLAYNALCGILDTI